MMTELVRTMVRWMPVAIALTASPAATADAGALRQIVREAERELAEGNPARALERLTDARRLAPDSAPIAYNQGVAAWRTGDAAAAMTFFREAIDRSDDPALRARAAYNLGTAAHRSLIDGSASTDDLESAQAMLEEAIERYREALSADPSDVDAQANGEMAWRLLEELRAMAEEQSQEQPDSGEQSEDQSGEQSGDQSEPQQGDDSSGEGSEGDSQTPQDGTQETSPEGGDTGEESGADPAAQDAAEQSEEMADDPAEAESSALPDDAPSDEPSDGTSEDLSNDEEDGTDEELTSPATSDAREGMSREEAERMLQIIRDGEARRREELRQRQRAAAPPVERDW